MAHKMNAYGGLSNPRSKILRILERGLKVSKVQYLKDDGSEEYKSTHNKLADYNYERYTELVDVKFEDYELIIASNLEQGAVFSLTMVGQDEVLSIDPVGRLDEKEERVLMEQTLTALSRLDSSDTAKDILSILSDFKVAEIF
ncbi:TPA: hypothetical protein ACH6AG_000066 [Campylobacter jejuni]